MNLTVAMFSGLIWLENLLYLEWPLPILQYDAKSIVRFGSM